jgi:hypothetical protein
MYCMHCAYLCSVAAAYGSSRYCSSSAVVVVAAAAAAAAATSAALTAVAIAIIVEVAFESGSSNSCVPTYGIQYSGTASMAFLE